MIDSIFAEPNIRKWVQNRSFPHFVYLISAFIFSAIFTLVWGLFSLNFQHQILFIGLILGLGNGFISYLFMHYQNKYKLIFYSILFSFLSILVAKYFYFMHYFNWQSALYINKDEVSLGLLIEYLRYFRGSNLRIYIDYLQLSNNFFNILIFLVALLSPFMYIVFAEEDEDDDGNKIETKTNQSQRLIKRRFDF